MSSIDFTVEEKKEIKREAVKRSAIKARKSKGDFLKTLPLCIATLIVILTISLIWTDVRITDLFTIKFAADLLAFLLLFWMMFFTMQSSGNTGGKADEEYASVRNRYREERDKIRKTGSEFDLPDFCDFYSNKEIRDYRRSLLLNANIRIEEWEEKYSDLDDHALLVLLPRRKFYRKIRSAELEEGVSKKLCALRKLSARKKGAIVKACLARPLEISPDLIMLDDGEKTSRTPIAEKSIKQKQTQRDIFALIRITLMMFLSISLAGEFIFTLSPSTFVFGMVKLSSLAVTGYQGYHIGYTVYTEYGVRRLNDQINLISVFWRWKRDTRPDQILEETKEQA